jgi:hypothetical protein
MLAGDGGGGGGEGRAGVPMEVMGLMLGDFVDEYTVRVVDVFAMPQVLLRFLQFDELGCWRC